MPTWRGDSVFVHFPRTGSNWTCNILSKRGGTTAEVHDPPWSFAESDWDKTLISNSRDPWSWYGSLWLIAAKKHRRLAKIQGAGEWDFKTMLRVWTHPHEDPRGLQAWITPVWDVQAQGLCRERVLASNCGLWSWFCSYFYATRETWGLINEFEWGVDYLVDHARLVDGWSIYLQEDLSSESARIADGTASRDLYRKSHNYADWYDDEMMEWVLRRDEWGLDLLGYQEASGFSKFNSLERMR